MTDNKIIFNSVDNLLDKLKIKTQYTSLINGNYPRILNINTLDLIKLSQIDTNNNISYTCINVYYYLHIATFYFGKGKDLSTNKSMKTNYFNVKPLNQLENLNKLFYDGTYNYYYNVFLKYTDGSQEYKIPLYYLIYCMLDHFFQFKKADPADKESKDSKDNYEIKKILKDKTLVEIKSIEDISNDFAIIINKVIKASEPEPSKAPEPSTASGASTAPEIKEANEKQNLFNQKISFFTSGPNDERTQIYIMKKLLELNVSDIDNIDALKIYLNIHINVSEFMYDKNKSKSSIKIYEKLMNVIKDFIKNEDADLKDIFFNYNIKLISNTQIKTKIQNLSDDYSSSTNKDQQKILLIKIMILLCNGFINNLIYVLEKEAEEKAKREAEEKAKTGTSKETEPEIKEAKTEPESKTSLPDADEISNKLYDTVEKSKIDELKKLLKNFLDNKLDDTITLTQNYIDNINKQFNNKIIGDIVKKINELKDDEKKNEILGNIDSKISDLEANSKELEKLYNLIFKNINDGKAFDALKETIQKAIDIIKILDRLTGEILSISENKESKPSGGSRRKSKRKQLKK